MAARPHRLTVVQHNVLSWGGSRVHNLNRLYSELDPDVILINSHCRNDNFSMRIFGYDTYLRNKHGNRADGVAIAVKRHLKYKINDNFNSETMSITIETTQGQLTLATSYLPPVRNYLPMYDMFRLSSLPHPCYMLGDLNAHHRMFGYRGTNKVGRALNALVDRGEWTHLGPNFKTFYGPGGTGTPDVVLCNRHAVLNHHIMPGHSKAGSDHTPIKMIISTSPIIIPTPKRFIYSEANWDEYRRVINEELILPELNHQPTESLEQAVTHFYEVLQRAKRAAIPEKENKVKLHAKRSRLLTRLEHQLSDLREDGDCNGWDRQKYRTQMQLIAQILQETKRLHTEQWQERLAGIVDHANDPKKFWAMVNRLKSKEHVSKLDYMYDKDGNECYHSEGQERVLREHWKNVFNISEAENLAFDHDYEDLVVDFVNEHMDELSPHNTIELDRLNEDNWLTSAITEEDVKRTIKSFKNGKAPGLSGITKTDLAMMPAVAITFMAAIFTASLAAGYFPLKFKEAKLIFIRKSGKDIRQPASYRPISLLEVPGKCLEKIINERVQDFCENNNVHDPNQYGFRPKRGTTRAVALGYEMVANHLPMRGAATIVTRDIEKAFDKVWHDSIRERLIEIALPNALARISSDFLWDRTARIRVNEVLGPPIELLAGVPQGSCLSPTLFIINTADTPPPNPRDNSTHISYADDHTQFILQPTPHPRAQARKTSRAINERNTYELKKKITNNLGKMKILTATKLKPEEVVVDERQHEINQTVVFLGLTLTNYGFRSHITNMKKKASRNLTKLRRFTLLPAGIKLRLYKSLIRPMLEYPPVPTHAASRSAILTLQVVQNRALYWVDNPGNLQPRRRRPSVDYLHRTYRVQPVNVRLHRLARRVWERLDEDEDVNYRRIRQMEVNLRELVAQGAQEEHRWFPRSRPRAMGNPPLPVLTATDITRYRRQNL